VTRLSQKVKMATKQKTKNFQCDTCDYSAIHQSGLNQHSNLVHLKLKNIECTQCSYKCETKGALKQHAMNIHTKRRDFQCNYCDKPFGQLKQDNSVHFCQLCDKQYAWKQDLKKHVRLHHPITSDRYWCNLCDYSSHYKCRLAKHSNSVTHQIKKQESSLVQMKEAQKDQLFVSVKKNNYEEGKTTNALGFHTILAPKM
jgi:hypothetical protein